ncbi:MAG: hypothetical protein GY938_13125 [Ketobacter sp.]|nr:hypothetical protein [Ketobacter sp.]
MYTVLKKPITRFHEQQVALEQREAQEGEEEGTITFMTANGDLVTRKLIQLPILQIKEARAVLNDVAMEMGDRRGYIPKEDGVMVHVTAEDLQHAVSGMEQYEENLKSAWDISNPEFIGDIAELRVPEDLEAE